MNSLFQLIGLGMGVLLAVSHTSPAIAQAASKTTTQPKESSQAVTPDAAKLPANSAEQKPPSRADSALSPQPSIQPEANPSATDKPTPTSVTHSVPTPEAAKQASDPVTQSAQNSSTTTEPSLEVNPAPVTPLAPTFTSPAPAIPTTEPLIPTQPIGPAKPGAAPDYLNPSPNPLSLPTKPEEVKLRGIQPITLQQALELAKRNNPGLQSTYFQYERSRAQVRQAQAALYPTLGVQGSITQSLSAQAALQAKAQQRAFEEAGVPEELRQNNPPLQASLGLQGTFQVGYNIFTSGRRPAQIRAAEQQLRSDQLQIEVNWQQLQLDVSNAYYNLQQADEAVRIAQSAVRNAEASLRDTIALERAGLGTRFDVLRAQVQLANNQQQLTSALGSQQINRRTLAQLLSISPSIDLAAADPVQIAGRWPLSLEDTIVLALKNRAELEQLLAQRELAEQQKKAALASLGPTLALAVQYNTVNNLRDQLGFGNGYSAGLQMNWDFFQGGAARAQANQQEANKAIAEANFANTRNQIRLQVETAYSNLGTSFQNIDTSRQAVVQAREALRLARLRFQAGVGTQTDVINSENDLTNAEGNLVRSILDYNRALAQLTRAVTNLPIPSGSQIPSIPTDSPTAPANSPAAPPSTSNPNPSISTPENPSTSTPANPPTSSPSPSAP